MEFYTGFPQILEYTLIASEPRQPHGGRKSP